MKSLKVEILVMGQPKEEHIAMVKIEDFEVQKIVFPKELVKLEPFDAPSVSLIINLDKHNGF